MGQQESRSSTGPTASSSSSPSSPSADRERLNAWARSRRGISRSRVDRLLRRPRRSAAEGATGVAVPPGGRGHTATDSDSEVEQNTSVMTVEEDEETETEDVAREERHLSVPRLIITKVTPVVLPPWDGDERNKDKGNRDEINGDETCGRGRVIGRAAMQVDVCRPEEMDECLAPMVVLEDFGLSPIAEKSEIALDAHAKSNEERDARLQRAGSNGDVIAAGVNHSEREGNLCETRGRQEVSETTASTSLCESAELKKPESDVRAERNEVVSCSGVAIQLGVCTAGREEGRKAAREENGKEGREEGKKTGIGEEDRYQSYYMLSVDTDTAPETSPEYSPGGDVFSNSVMSSDNRSESGDDDAAFADACSQLPSDAAPDTTTDTTMDTTTTRRDGDVGNVRLPGKRKSVSLSRLEEAGGWRPAGHRPVDAVYSVSTSRVLQSQHSRHSSLTDGEGGGAWTLGGNGATTAASLDDVSDTGLGAGRTRGGGRAVQPGIGARHGEGHTDSDYAHDWELEDAARKRERPASEHGRHPSAPARWDSYPGKWAARNRSEGELSQRTNGEGNADFGEGKQVKGMAVYSREHIYNLLILISNFLFPKKNYTFRPTI